MAELVPAVARRIRLHAGEHAIAGKQFDRLRAWSREPEELAHGIAPGEQPRRRHRRRRDARVARVRHLPRHVDEHRIARQLAYERVLKPRAREINRCRVAPGSGESHGRLWRVKEATGGLKRRWC